MFVEDIPLRIARLRNAKGVSARDMSLSLGQNENYINHIENGKALPSMDAFFNICDYLGISEREFFDDGVQNPVRLRGLIEDLKKLSDEQLEAVASIVRTMVK